MIYNLMVFDEKCNFFHKNEIPTLDKMVKALTKDDNVPTLKGTTSDGKIIDNYRYR